MKSISDSSRLLHLALAVTAFTLNATADEAADLATLRQELQQLRAEVAALKTNTPATPPPATESHQVELFGTDLLKVKGLSIGFYGEAKYRLPEAGADTFDPHRYVLTPSYQLSDWLIFNSEFELEHGAVDESTNGGRNRFDGELELEQMYVDILLHEHFNLRSLGISLIPVGRVNLYHEPTTFYSTERPELYREIIPSTWFEPAFGCFGKITDTLDYQLMVSVGLEDYVGSAPTAAGVTAVNGVRNARPRMRAASESKLAYSGRLHYRGFEGFDASTSFYASPSRGFNQQDVFLGLWDIEAAYRIPGTGLELRGDFACWWIDNPENLIANNTGTTADDLGERMYGWYLEAAYHFWPEAWRSGLGREMDVVPFIRYTSLHTQSELLPGSTKITNGTANRDFLTFGVAWFLNANFVLKADWRRNLDGSAASATSGASQDYMQVGMGVAF